MPFFVIEPTHLQRKALLSSLLKMICWLKTSSWPRPWRLLQPLWVIFPNNYMQCNLLQPCTVEDATFVGVLMSQAHAWFKTMQPTRSTTWELRISMDSKATTKEDHLDSIKGKISHRDKAGGIIWVTSSTRSKKVSLSKLVPSVVRFFWSNSRNILGACSTWICSIQQDV